MRKNLIPFILFSAIVLHFISCSSGDDNKYSLLTKADRKNIDSFCICASPYIEFWDNSGNLKDSANVIKYMDSIVIILSKFTACSEFLKTINADKKNSKEYETEMLDYIKVKHRECYDFLTEKKKKNK